MAGGEAAAELLRTLLVAGVELLGLDFDLFAGAAVAHVHDVARRFALGELGCGFGEGLPAAGAQVCLEVVERPPDLAFPAVEPFPVRGGEGQELAEGDAEAAADPKIGAQRRVSVDDLAG